MSVSLLEGGAHGLVLPGADAPLSCIPAGKGPACVCPAREIFGHGAASCEG